MLGYASDAHRSWHLPNFAQPCPVGAYVIIDAFQTLCKNEGRTELDPKVDLF